VTAGFTNHHSVCASVAAMTQAVGVDHEENRFPMWLCDEPECTRGVGLDEPEMAEWLPTEDAHFCPKHASLRFGQK